MQKDFDKLIKLISSNNNPIVIELLSHCLETEITYSTFHKESCQNNRAHLAKSFQERWDFIKIMRNSEFVKGFEEVVPKLNQTKFNNIGISNITSNYGNYLVFTDDNKKNFIGILKSKRTLTEIRDKYRHHKKLVEQMGESVLYDYEEHEIVFYNGILQKK